MRKGGDPNDINSSKIDALKNFKIWFQKKMLEIDRIYHGGPLFFYQMMKISIRTTNEATQKLIKRICNLNISTIRGENILQVTSIIHGAVTRMGDKVLLDITNIVLKVYQTKSYTKFNRLFKQMEGNI